MALFSNNFGQLNGLYDNTINEICHQIHAYTTLNESYTYSQMLHQEDHKQFFAAMEVELDDHKTCKHWNPVECKDLPSRAKTIMAIWSFKRKWFPDGTLNKQKTRLCAHGTQQPWKQDYWDTYAPLVTWASVQLLLIIAKIHGLESRSINIVIFLQADLDLPVYMELPVGSNPVDISDEKQCCCVLKLNKSLYELN